MLRDSPWHRWLKMIFYKWKLQEPLEAIIGRGTKRSKGEKGWCLDRSRTRAHRGPVDRLLKSPLKDLSYRRVLFFRLPERIDSSYSPSRHLRWNLKKIDTLFPPNSSTHLHPLSPDLWQHHADWSWTLRVDASSVGYSNSGDVSGLSIIVYSWYRCFS